MCSVRTHRYRPSQYKLLCTFTVHKITVTQNVCCQNTPVQTVTVQIVMYVHCAQHYCNTKCVAARTHRYTSSQYNLLCTFSVHNITVTHNVLLPENTATHRHIIIYYVRSVCTTLLLHTMCCCKNTPVHIFTV
jgi:hypothetical protein